MSNYGIDLFETFSETSYGIEELLKSLFVIYDIKKQSNELYNKVDYFPQNLISLYYQIVDKPRFDEVITHFKEKYIKNESDLESVHEEAEREGFAEMYEYIHSYVEGNNLNIYMVLKLHQLLFSKTPNPQAGGLFRNQDVYLPNSGIEIEHWMNISFVFSSMYASVNQLIQKGIQLGISKSSKEIIDYIDACIKLKCELIRIHPFYDGNGRTMRAFLNFLFKLANIPFVYIKPSEKEPYGNAMNRAIVDHNYDPINKFYYHKICDSIYELDIKLRMNKKDSFIFEPREDSVKKLVM